MNSLPYMPLYIGDYLSDTAHLTTLEHGAYILLIMNYWQRAKPLDNSNGRLANVARLSNQDWAIVEPTLKRLFTVDGDIWVHDRVERELSKVKSKSEKAKKAGKASASKRANKRSTNVKRTPNHTDTDTDTDSKDSYISGSPEREAFDAFNEVARRTGLPLAQAFTESRKAKLRQRLAECGGMEGWLVALDKLATSAFCTGTNGNGWKADLDFLLQQKSFTKLMEGSYDNRAPPKKPDYFDGITTAARAAARNTEGML